MKTKDEIQKKYEMYYNKWRDYDLLTSILSILGLVVGIIDVIEFFIFIQHEYTLAVYPYEKNPSPDTHDSFVRFIITITSLFAGKKFLIVYYSYFYFSETLLKNIMVKL